MCARAQCSSQQGPGVDLVCPPFSPQLPTPTLLSETGSVTELAILTKLANQQGPPLCAARPAILPYIPGSANSNSDPLPCTADFSPTQPPSQFINFSRLLKDQELRNSLRKTSDDLSETCKQTLWALPPFPVREEVSSSQPRGQLCLTHSWMQTRLFSI